MKKIMLVLAIALSIVAVPNTSFAHGWHHHGGWHHGGWHHCHRGGWWGVGGRNFWPGFVGGVVGGVVAGAVARPYYYGPSTVVVQQPASFIAPSPTVIQQPVVVQQPTVIQQPVVVQQPRQVWVPGMYVDQVQANGSTVRIWQPGHYEYR